MTEDAVAYHVDRGLARVALDPLDRDEPSRLVVSLEVLRERDVEALEDVHAGEVAACVVIADDRKAEALLAEVEPPNTQCVQGLCVAVGA